MLNAFFLSIGQLFDPRVAAVFVKSLLLTLALFAVAAVGIWFAMHWFAAALGAWLGEGSWTRGAADVATIVLVLLAHWLLFRAIAIGVIGVFADEVVNAVEARHYPQAHAEARDVPLGRSVLMGLGSAARLILINVLLAPLYLILLVTGVGTAVAFFLVNAWLLGRDLGDMVAARHLPKRVLPDWRGRTRLRRFALGAVGTGLFFVPVLNLLAPVIGAAMAAHLYHRGARR